MKRTFLSTLTLALAAIALISGCSQNTEAAVTRTPEGCVISNGNGVYTLNALSSTCAHSGTADMLASFIATHPTLHVVAFTQVFNIPTVIVVTEQK